MHILRDLVLVVTVCIAGVGLLVLIGLVAEAFYRWLRRSLYARPLTAEERWSETSVESRSEEEWAALLASEEHLPPIDKVE